MRGNDGAAAPASAIPEIPLFKTSIVDVRCRDALAKGRAVGETTKQLEIAAAMKRKDVFSVQEIEELIGLSAERVESL